MKDTVYTLIQSLSSREKSYFKRYSKIHGDSDDRNYLHIYNYLEKQKSYDEVKLKSHFKGKQFANYLSSEKNYLLEQLLNSLMNFHMGTTVRGKLARSVVHIDILMQRGLDSKALKLLKQAKILAYKYEEFTTAQLLIRFEEEIIFKHGVIKYTDQLKELEKEREQCISRVNNINKLRIIKAQARELQFVEQYYVKDPENYPDLFNNPMLDNEENALSLIAKDYWHYIREIRHYLLREFDKSFECLEEYLDFFEKHEYLFGLNNKLPLLSNYLYLASKTKQTSKFHFALKKLEAIKSVKGIDERYIDYIKYSRLLELYYKTGDLKKTADLLPEIEEYFKKQATLLGPTEADYILILLIRAHIGLDRFSMAQYWINRWYEMDDVEVSFNLIKLFGMIIYYELGYFSLLESECDSAYKMLRKRKRFGLLEQEITAFFRKAARNPNHPEILSRIESLHDRLLQLRKNPEESMLFEYFDFCQWTAKKMGKK